MSYFGNIKRGIKTTAKGMSLTFKHLLDARFSRAEKQITDTDFFSLDKGHVTIQYPHQTIDIPDHGRNQLDCEIDDCIVCDKCAKICPVDCIEIEAIKSPELIRTTSDGSPVRLHAAKFDIDLAKCCFCGLCTTVCPTECLTMNSEYDYPVMDITQLNFAFANLSETEAQEKRELYDQFVAEKEALKVAMPAIKPTVTTSPSFVPKAKPLFMPIAKSTEEVAKPSFKPGMKASILDKEVAKLKPLFTPGIKQSAKSESTNESIKPKPAFTPGLKPAANLEEKAMPVFRPDMKPAAKSESAEESVKPKPAFRPGMKPAANSEEKAKPVFRPGMKPAAKSESADESIKPKPAFTPGMKPSANSEEKAKPVFRPGMKPAVKSVSADENTKPAANSEEKTKPDFKPKKD